MTQESNFNVDIGSFRDQQIKVLLAIKREGEKHLKYFKDTMSAFKHPELRAKTFDTKYYEDALPEIDRILNEREQLKKNG